MSERDAQLPAAVRFARLRRPPISVAVVVCTVAIVGMAMLRLWVFHDKVMPIAYGVPLVLFVWLRSRPLLWLTVIAFTIISIVKFFLVLPHGGGGSFPLAIRVLDFLIIQLDLLLIASIVHALILVRDRVESRNAELKQSNLQLEASNKSLAAREEDVARQNEELQSQAEELERQTEEMRVANEELTRREHVTETLLALSRGLTTELTRQEMISRICEVVVQLIDGPGTAAAVLEQEGGALRILCQYGFGADGPREMTVPLERSLGALVLSRGRTAYLDDLSQRPDLILPQRASGESFVAVIAAPLRAAGWPVGTLEVYRSRPGAWTDQEISVVDSLAAQTSISLEALRHLQQVTTERRRFESVLRAAPVGISVCDADCSDVRLNPAGAAMFAVPADTNILEDSTFSAASIFREGREITAEDWPLFRAARDGVDVLGVDMEVVLPTGRRLALLVNATPVRDGGGKSMGAVAAFVDITPLKELQRELDARRREAEEASVRKTRFLAAVSHDIRTPANAITLLAELIRRTSSNPAMAGEVPELAKEIHSSALSLVEILGDVLDLARYDSGRLEMQETEFSLGELLVDEHRRLLPLAREKGLALNLTLPDEPVRLRTDRIKLSRVIGNLVGNAIKFTSAGEVSIEAARDANGTEDGRAAPVIRVRDTGIGIELADQQFIFDEFVQLHNRERDRNKGTGLGLTICKRLVDAMGGRLALDSNPGRGSTFTVTLPPGSVVA